ncbi:hypothetical protein D918_05314 [Trichuris suis]|nr:hypothetical protein D918_05314 [Trichuris suis]
MGCEVLLQKSVVRLTISISKFMQLSKIGRRTRTITSLTNIISVTPQNFQLLLDTIEEKASPLLKKLNKDHGQSSAHCKACAYGVTADLIIVLAEAALASFHTDRQIWVSPPSQAMKETLSWSKNLQTTNLSGSKKTQFAQSTEQQLQNSATKSEEHNKADEITLCCESVEPPSGLESLERKFRDDKPAVARIKPVKRQKPSEAIFKTPTADISFTTQSTAQMMNWDSSSIYSERAIDCPAEYSLWTTNKNTNGKFDYQDYNLSQVAIKSSSDSITATVHSPTEAIASSIRGRSTFPEQHAMTTPLPYSTVKTAQRIAKRARTHVSANIKGKKRLFHSSDELANCGVNEKKVEAGSTPEMPFLDAKEYAHELQMSTEQN